MKDVKDTDGIPDSKYFSYNKHSFQLNSNFTDVRFFLEIVSKYKHL